MDIRLQNTALVMIDVQNDFCPGGALAVSGGDEVAAPLNRMAAFVAQRGGKVIATQDWHPACHASFASSHSGKNPGETVNLPGVDGQILWPDHCVQGSGGADLHSSLDLKPVSVIIRKGFHQNLDSYSAFFENDRKTATGLDALLRSLSIDTVFIGGLATDYCVLFSALDAASLGYKTFVLTDACRAVGVPDGSAERALKQLQGAGVIITESSNFLNEGFK
ncbi:MAG: bifunctional nicotinamidase/pyrazinamidase [Treponema sp.]|nr:bifunctional nicotinamidase/pyrazinamidase [Treponema sp.]